MCNKFVWRQVAERAAWPSVVIVHAPGLKVSAVASLDKSIEKTLTLHRLGLVPTLGVSLKATNCLESLNAQLDQLTDKMDRWRTRSRSTAG